MHRLTDEQIEAARGTPVRGIGAFWRNVADAAADHARDVTVREIFESLRQAAYFCSSDHIKDKYPTVFAAPTPQPPAPVNDEPALDEATVRKCIEFLNSEGFAWAPAAEAHLAAKFLPQPATLYLTVEQVERILEGIGIGIPLVDDATHKSIIGYAKAVARPLAEINKENA